MSPLKARSRGGLEYTAPASNVNNRDATRAKSPRETLRALESSRQQRKRTDIDLYGQAPDEVGLELLRRVVAQVADVDVACKRGEPTTTIAREIEKKTRECTETAAARARLRA